jgi:membrane protease YdiL (CAAX protease family)
VTGASVRTLVVATLLQGAFATVLVARGAVSFAPLTPPAAFGVVAGAATGYGLYRLLAQRGAGPRQHVSSGAILTLAFAYLVISVAEEIIWRGYAFGMLAPLRGPLVAVVATTLGFALAHGVHQGFVGVRFHLLTGLAFALTLLATRSLAAAAAAHATYNLTVFLRTVSIRKKASYDRLVVG